MIGGALVFQFSSIQSNFATVNPTTVLVNVTGSGWLIGISQGPTATDTQFKIVIDGTKTFSVALKVEQHLTLPVVFNTSLVVYTSITAYSHVHYALL